MKDSRKPKAQLIEGLALLRHWITELEDPKAARRRAEEVLRWSKGQFENVLEKGLVRYGFVAPLVAAPGERS